MRIRDLKVATQLEIGFGIIFLLIASIGLISWIQSDRIAEQTVILYDHPLMVRRALGELKADVLLMQRGMKDLCLAENDSEILSALQEIDVYKTNASKQFDVLYDRYLGPRADIDAVFNDFIKWGAIREETLSLLHEDRVKEALSRTKSEGDGGKHVEMLLSHIQVIDDFALKKGNQLYRNAVKLDDSLDRQMGLFVAGILALTLLIVIVLTRHIRHPLKEITNAAKQFREGKMEVRSQYSSRNEFGLLSASFNELADTIETELTLDTQAANLAGVMLSEDDARRFCHALLKSLLEHTGAQMGAVYLLNDEKSEFESFESIGIDAEGCMPFSATRFEGEFGTALATRELQHIANIPEDTRFTFFTVAGKFVPREIITIPVVVGDETVAVISLANIKSFSGRSLRLLNTVLATLSARLDGILSYRKIVAFSQKLEHQNTELEAQKKELAAQTSELSEQNVELEMQKEQLDEASRLKTTFLSNMSHELRTPLNSVIALSGVLSRRLAGKVPAEEHGYLDVIERNGKQLLLLINDILDLSRIEAGREDVEIHKFKVKELIDEVVAVLELQAQQKNIVLGYAGNDSLPEIMSDYDKCRHILQNIVANAVKFTEKGEVEITAEEKDGSVRISVTDTGIGIEKDFIPLIFDEFRQIDSSNSRKYGGTGLGLAIAKKYAGMLGGSIAVESERGKGSRFTISLPLHFTASRTSAEMTPREHRLSVPKTGHHPGKIDAKNKTILLVEDTEAVIIQMKDILEMQGYKVMVARSGGEALNQIAQKIPDAMILDLMMPGVDGFEVLKSIRSEEKTDHLPVIILTAKYVTKDELAFLKHNSIHQLIHKGDINKDQLLEAVARMMSPESKEIAPPQKKEPAKPVPDTPVVLVVEDNPDNMLTIKALLAGKCEAILAEDGRVVIELAREHKPHLILMDIALPGLNGIEVLKELRKDETLRHIPVVAVSASAMKGDRDSFMDLGFDGYISKPIDNKVFTRVVGEWIGQ